MTTRPPSPAATMDFGILLGLAYQAFVEELRTALYDEGFTDLGPAYGYVFRALDAESLQTAQLAVRLGMSDQGAAKIVLEMEGRGYVERHPDPADGRGKLIRLTSRGQSALRTARRFHDAFERRLRRRAGASTVDRVRRVLTECVGGEPRDLEHARLRAP